MKMKYEYENDKVFKKIIVWFRVDILKSVKRRKRICLFI